MYLDKVLGRYQLLQKLVHSYLNNCSSINTDDICPFWRGGIRIAPTTSDARLLISYLARW